MLVMMVMLNQQTKDVSLPAVLENMEPPPTVQDPWLIQAIV